MSRALVPFSAEDLSSFAKALKKRLDERQTLLQFDEAGRLVRLPNKRSVQQMAAWALWTQFTARRDYSEKEVNAILNARHTFGDPATLRRELVNMKLLGRESDCSRYWKAARRPDEATRLFLRAWRARVH